MWRSSWAWSRPTQPQVRVLCQGRRGDRARRSHTLRTCIYCSCGPVLPVRQTRPRGCCTCSPAWLLRPAASTYAPCFGGAWTDGVLPDNSRHVRENWSRDERGRAGTAVAVACSAAAPRVWSLPHNRLALPQAIRSPMTPQPCSRSTAGRRSCQPAPPPANRLPRSKRRRQPPGAAHERIASASVACRLARRQRSCETEEEGGR